MPALAVTKTYSNGATLTETDLDNIKSSIETFFNTTKIDSSNVQTGWITTSHLSGSAGITGSQLSSSAGILGSQLSASAAIAGTQLAANPAFSGNGSISGTWQIGGGPTLSYVTTSPSVNRLRISSAIQPVSSSCGFIDIFGSSTRTLSIKDSSTGTGFPIVTSFGPNTHGLHIIRGTVSLDKTTVTNGEGFTSSSGGTGIFNISFNTSFATAPVVVTCCHNANAAAFTNSSSTSGAVIKTFTTSTNALSDNPIDFIAIGERGS